MVDSSHKAEWEKNEKLWRAKSKSKDDIWDRKSLACTNLLENLNNKKK